MTRPDPDQPDLFGPPPPDKARDGAAWLATFLMANPRGPAEDGSWPGRRIMAHCNLPWDETARRRLRAFASAGRPNIVSGPHGYKHALHATQAEREHAARRRLSAARKQAHDAIRELRALEVFDKLAGRA